ncbi:hypothetical protein [Macrococcoides caseolyticum]|uniref:hypothetical protein n=1 Tax=Macrococcoides caseolyticum TaxID=69966 RepID=UPI001F3A11DE|nr:hypothetical protein [Macrococcus caseolyticus]MCE4956612.1 hypothetical protein [Macrococcus caseolyticus]
MINDNEKFVTYTIDTSRSYSIHYKLSNANTSMKPEYGFTEGQYYVDSIHINDIGNTKVSDNMVGDTFKSSRIETSFGSSIENIKFGLENLHVTYNMDVMRPDLNQVLSYSIHRYPRYDSNNYGPYK